MRPLCRVILELKYLSLCCPTALIPATETELGSLRTQRPQQRGQGIETAVGWATIRVWLRP